MTRISFKFQVPSFKPEKSGMATRTLSAVAGIITVTSILGLRAGAREFTARLDEFDRLTRSTPAPGKMQVAADANGGYFESDPIATADDDETPEPALRNTDVSGSSSLQVTSDPIRLNEINEQWLAAVLDCFAIVATLSEAQKVRISWLNDWLWQTVEGIPGRDDYSTSLRRIACDWYFNAVESELDQAQAAKYAPVRRARLVLTVNPDPEESPVDSNSTSN